MEEGKGGEAQLGPDVGAQHPGRVDRVAPQRRDSRGIKASWSENALASSIDLD